jgi:hypothetical protein
MQPCKDPSSLGISRKAFAMVNGALMRRSCGWAYLTPQQCPKAVLLKMSVVGERFPDLPLFHDPKGGTQIA